MFKTKEKRLSRKLFSTVCLLGGILSFSVSDSLAQGKIRDASLGPGSLMPNSNAVLELESSSKGLLLPRVALSSLLNMAPLAAHVPGMTVYNTATAGTPPTNVSPGEYYNDGTQWIRIGTNAAAWLPNIRTISANYTLSSADSLGIIYVDNGSADITINLPASLKPGFKATIVQAGTGQVICMGGHNVNNDSILSGQYAVAQVLCPMAGLSVLYGDLMGKFAWVSPIHLNDVYTSETSGIRLQLNASKYASAYSVIAGALPTGLFMNALGMVTGYIDSTRMADSTFHFTVLASSLSGGTLSRSFSWTLKGVQHDTITASGKWVLPSSGYSVLNEYGLDVLIAGGGGAGGRGMAGGPTGGGGGGGAQVLDARIKIPFTLGDSILVTIGSGGIAPGSGAGVSSCGGQSKFGSFITAVGGGGGGGLGSTACMPVAGGSYGGAGGAVWSKGGGAQGSVASSSRNGLNGYFSTVFGVRLGGGGAGDDFFGSGAPGAGGGGSAKANGASNTGGGGGGAQANFPGNGGSGVIYVAY